MRGGPPLPRVKQNRPPPAPRVHCTLLPADVPEESKWVAGPAAAPADPTGRSEAETGHQGHLALGRGGQVFYPLLNQSLDLGHPGKERPRERWL